MMNILKSKTVWTLILLGAYNGLESIHGLLPASFAPYINVILTIAGIWFRTHPVQQY